jgi:hypothetical protein
MSNVDAAFGEDMGVEVSSHVWKLEHWVAGTLVMGAGIVIYLF